MKNGYKVIDMDTHVGPRNDILYKYMGPSRIGRMEPPRAEEACASQPSP